MSLMHLLSIMEARTIHLTQEQPLPGRQSFLKQTHTRYGFTGPRIVDGIGTITLSIPSIMQVEIPFFSGIRGWISDSGI